MKKISILICIQLALSPAFVFANAVGGTVGGWRITSNVAQGIGAKITATKDVIINGASKAVSSSATVLPKAADVGKFIGKNLGAAAVIGAMDLVLDGVDYVMDPANNTVKFHEKVQDQKCDATSCASLLNIFQINNYTNVGTFSTIEAAATHYAEKIMSGVKNREAWTCSQILWNTYRCEAKAKNEAGYNISVGIDIVQVSNPNYDQSKEEERNKTVPLADIGQQVIDLAETEVKTGNPAVAVPLTRAVAQDMIQEAESDDTKARPIVTELDSSASIPTTETAEGTITTPTDPTTGESKPQVSDIALEFPVFCNWAPNMCVLAQDATNFMADVRDWVSSEPDFSEKQEELEIDELEMDKDPSSFDIDYISFGNQCPTFEAYTVEVGSVSKTLTMDLKPLCDFATEVRPAILGVSYLTAAAIVIAAIRET